jgi:hypothetical protein
MQQNCKVNVKVVDSQNLATYIPVFFYYVYMCIHLMVVHKMDRKM